MLPMLSNKAIKEISKCFFLMTVQYIKKRRLRNMRKGKASPKKAAGHIFPGEINTETSASSRNAARIKFRYISCFFTKFLKGTWFGNKVKKTIAIDA
jgi:hypothetical protein